MKDKYSYLGISAETDESAVARLKEIISVSEFCGKSVPGTRSRPMKA